MDPLVSLARRWAVDRIASADPQVCAEILSPEYRILIGGYTLGPRDAYIAETVQQLERFPGLGLTIHELIWSGDRLAVRFTEHGASVKLTGRRAAGPPGAASPCFARTGGQLTECFAEADYYGRRRQLSEGECDPIEPPASAPWNTPAGAPDPVAESVVCDWLAQGDLSGVELDDGWTGQDVRLHLDEPLFDCNELFSASGHVAFHGHQRGVYAGGLGDPSGGLGDPSGELGAEAALHLAGIVAVADGEVVGGRVIRDRLGLQRSLRATTTA